MRNPDGRCFINNLTGELFFSLTKIRAFLYFKADGKTYGYNAKWKDIRRYKADGSF